jgi:alpha-galactosidase
VTAGRFTAVAEVEGDLARAHVYEHGWQSWSPAGLYPARTACSPRPRRAIWQTMSFRPERPAPERGFQAEGLLAVLPAEGPVRLWAAAEPTREVPSVRAHVDDGRLVVAADGPVEELEVDAPLDVALARWAATIAARERLAVRTIEPTWCSWYAYWRGVTAADVLANLEAIDRLQLPIETVQVDDGYEAEIGDWLELSDGFGSLWDLAKRIEASGRRGGIWTAPFLVGERSRVALEHPDWLVQGAVAARHWDQEIRILDVTHPGAAEHLTTVFRTLSDAGFGFFKLDFIYAGAMHGRRREDIAPIAAYRRGLELIRTGAGPEAVLLASGAPLLPSIGLVDAMRVSPDIDPEWEPVDGDISQPAMRSALAMGRARAWMHGRLWVNDPDCLIARPEMERRELWASHLDAYGALAISSDPLDGLDARGLELTREILRPSSTAPVRWDPFAGPDQGSIRADGSESR